MGLFFIFFLFSSLFSFLFLFFLLFLFSFFSFSLFLSLFFLFCFSSLPIFHSYLPVEETGAGYRERSGRGKKEKKTERKKERAMTAQWLSATSERYAEKIRIMGIDLSKAFDCVDRITLMNTLEEHEIATEDELRILQHLVSETTLQVKIGETYGARFNTIIGVPQGDALSRHCS